MSEAAIASGLISAGTGAVTGAGEAKLNWEMQERAFEQSKEMWRLQNKYNLPVHQRKRLEQAGLNPALMYKQGSVGNTASGAPSMSAPTARLKAIESMMSMAQLKNLQMQNRKLDAESRKIGAEAKKQERVVDILDEMDKVEGFPRLMESDSFLSRMVMQGLSKQPVGDLKLEGFPEGHDWSKGSTWKEAWKNDSESIKKIYERLKEFFRLREE